MDQILLVCKAITSLRSQGDSSACLRQAKTYSCLRFALDTCRGCLCKWCSCPILGGVSATSRCRLTDISKWTSHYRELNCFTVWIFLAPWCNLRSWEVILSLSGKLFHHLFWLWKHFYQGPVRCHGRMASYFDLYPADFLIHTCFWRWLDLFPRKRITLAVVEDFLIW